jgi:hypothetical protein
MNLVPWLSVAQYALDRYSVADLIEVLGKQAREIVSPLSSR